MCNHALCVPRLYAPKITNMLRFWKILAKLIFKINQKSACQKFTALKNDCF